MKYKFTCPCCDKPMIYDTFKEEVIAVDPEKEEALEKERELNRKRINAMMTAQFNARNKAAEDEDDFFAAKKNPQEGSGEFYRDMAKMNAVLNAKKSEEKKSSPSREKAAKLVEQFKKMPPMPGMPGMSDGGFGSMPSMDNGGFGAPPPMPAMDNGGFGAPPSMSAMDNMRGAMPPMMDPRFGDISAAIPEDADWGLELKNPSNVPQMPPMDDSRFGTMPPMPSMDNGGFGAPPPMPAMYSSSSDEEDEMAMEMRRKAEEELDKELKAKRAEAKAKHEQAMAEYERKKAAGEIEEKNIVTRKVSREATNALLDSQIIKMSAQTQDKSSATDVPGSNASMTAVPDPMQFSNEAGWVSARMGASSAPIGGTWDCICGQEKNPGKYCSNCGKIRTKDQMARWDCSCGKMRIKGRFCSYCGEKRPGIE